jgi:hypothetical protein
MVFPGTSTSQWSTQLAWMSATITTLTHSATSTASSKPKSERNYNTIWTTSRLSRLGIFRHSFTCCPFLRVCPLGNHPFNYVAWSAPSRASCATPLRLGLLILAMLPISSRPALSISITLLLRVFARPLLTLWVGSLEWWLLVLPLHRLSQLLPPQRTPF